MKTRVSLLCALLLMAGPVLAQVAAPTLPSVDRLPADTWVLLVWHGSASTDKVRATNAVLRLWNDPDFKPARDRMTKMMHDEVDRGAQEGKEDFTKEDLDDVISLLENPLVFGIAGDPLAAMPGGGASSLGVFGVYNKKGKAELWARMEKRDAAKAKPNREVSTYAFRGVEIKKIVTTTPPEPVPAMDPEEGKDPEAEPMEPQEPKVETQFEATMGDLELFSDKQEVMETLITRLQDGPAAGDSLATNKTYQAAQRFRAEGSVLDAFLLIPDLSAVPIPPMPQADVSAIIRELHLERMQALTFSTGLAADKSTMRMALLGNTAPGSLLDLVGADSADFRTPVVAPDSASLAAFRIDLMAFYATLQRAAKAGLPPDQAAMADMLDGMVAMQTGKSLTELLGLLTGEVALISTGEATASEVVPGTFAISVTNGAPILELLRTLAGPMISDEEESSGATLLTVMRPPTPSDEEGAPPKENPPVHVAVASNMVLVSQSKSQVSEALGRLAAGTPAPAGSMAASPSFQAARKKMPEKMSGLFFADYARFPWEKQMAAMRKQFAEQKQTLLEQADAAMKGSEEVEPDPERAEALRRQAQQVDVIAEIMEGMMPLLKKYLHTSWGTVRKAPDGVFMESIVN